MEVSCATSFDERFDPANVLSSDPKSYWISTGLYPQEITFTLHNAKVVNEVKFVTNGARKIVIEGCPTATGNAFKVIGESKGKFPISLRNTLELGGKSGGLQSETIKIS